MGLAMAPVERDELLPPEPPFSFEERYRLRQLLEALEAANVTKEDLMAIKKLSASSRVAQVMVIGLGKFLLWASGLVGAAIAFRRGGGR